MIGPLRGERDVRRASWLAAAAVLGSALLLLPLPAWLDTPLARYAFDFGHAPLFGAAFLALRFLLPWAGPGSDAVPALVASAAGAAIEVVQGLSWRDASWRDLGSDLAGIALAWTGLVCWRRGRAWALGHSAVVAAAVLAAAGLIARHASVLRQLDAMMPLLAGFEHEWELDRWHAKRGTRLARTRESALEGEWSLDVSCSARARYPGVAIEDFAADWRGYRWLEWSVRLPSDEPLELLVRIDDDLGGAYGDRYTEAVRIVPGRQLYRIDLRQVASRFRAHPMNLGRITELHFFLDEPGRARRFLLDGIRLVEDAAADASSRGDRAGQTR